MAFQTTIAENVDITDVNARYDASCKRLLSEKMILAWIMKHCLDEFCDCSVKDIAEKYIEGRPQVAEVPIAPDKTGPVIRGMDREDVSLSEGTVTYDIRFSAVAPDSGDTIRLIINVEAQNDFYPGYPLLKRSIYYCSRMISAQYGTEFINAQYDKIKKVYSIWICMDAPQYRQNTITRYRITEENSVGHVKEAVRNYDLLSVIMICLGKADEKNDDSVLKLLNVLLSDEISAVDKKQILQEDFDIPMTQELEQEVSTMCNLSKGVMERAMKKGLEQGMAQGLERGMAQGLTEATLSSLRTLMKNMNLPAEKAMDILEIPEEERKNYIRLLMQ